MQLTFEFTKNGTPLIRVDKNTYMSFGNKELSYHGPWSKISLHGFTEIKYKGDVIRERVTEFVNLDRIQFKNITKKCIDPELLKHILKIVKKYINEFGKILDSNIPALKEEIEQPFELEKKKKVKTQLTLDDNGDVVKKKRGRPKKGE